MKATIRARIKETYEMVLNENPDKSFPWLAATTASILRLDYSVILDALLGDE